MFKIQNIQNGVNAVISGLKTEDISSKIDACKDGNCSCSCDPEIMKNIENIEVSSTTEGTNIKITGNVDAKTLEPMMQECLINQ